MAEQIEEKLSQLSVRHRAALQWFAEHAGQTEPWPKPVIVGGQETLLASKAKGIYKPEWSEYALSVRQSTRGPYPDQEPVPGPRGSWIYAYFQENKDESARDQEYTNRGMVACWRDSVPVGVIRQVAPKPASRYQVLGLAVVTGWEGGYFFLEGIERTASLPEPGPGSELHWLSERQQQASLAAGSFDPTSVIDGRERAVAQITLRRGQPEFRRNLIAAYQGRCAITQCNVVEALEAAHVTPFLGSETNRIDNGILLRADLHTLFDLGLISVDPDALTVLIAEELDGTEYGGLAGTRLHLPLEPSLRPSVNALKAHRRWSGL